MPSDTESPAILQAPESAKLCEIAAQFEETPSSVPIPTAPALQSASAVPLPPGAQTSHDIDVSASFSDALSPDPTETPSTSPFHAVVPGSAALLSLETISKVSVGIPHHIGIC